MKNPDTSLNIFLEFINSFLCNVDNILFMTNSDVTASKSAFCLLEYVCVFIACFVLCIERRVLYCNGRFVLVKVNLF